MVVENNNKLLKIKYNFDRFTSQNSQNWQLVLFWIIVFEIMASALEYFSFDNSAQFIGSVPDSTVKEIFIGLLVTVYIWGCIYNIIFANKTVFFLLALFGVTGVYMITTHDLTLNFVLHNLEPTHFFQMNFGMVMFIEILFKLIITYLIYQLIVSLKNRKKA